MAMDEYNNRGGFYVRLEVAPTAPHTEITRAYRRLALSAHPDAHPDDPDAARRFREITEAYEVLGDPARRARYDADEARGCSVPGPPSAPNRTETAAPGPGARLAPTSSSPWRSPGPGAPVVIGTAHRLSPSALFWAGPVHRGAAPPRTTSAIGQAHFASEVARLVSELVGPWEWY